MTKRPTDIEIIESVGGLERWAKKCHEASVAFINTDIAPKGARVARGFCEGVGSQHSWVVIGDPYDEAAEIIDLTLWSWIGADPHVRRGTALEIGRNHRPHGSGNIWNWGKPVCGDGERFEPEGLSDESRRFLALCAPNGLDRQGWSALLHAPVGGGWPAKDIITCAHRDKRLSALIPIDIVGMVTDENPGGLYLPDDTRRPQRSPTGGRARGSFERVRLTR